MRRITLASLAAGVVIVVAGCSTGAETSTESEPSASSSSEGPTTPEPSEPEASAVAPATGTELTVELTSGTMTIRAPDDFGDEADRNPDGGLIAQFPDIRNFLELRVQQYSPFGDADLGVFAAARSDSPVTGEPMERLPDVVIDGETAYQLAGPDPLFDGWRHEFGVRYDEYDIFINLNSPLDTPQAQRDATNASVLASVTLP